MRQMFSKGQLEKLIKEVIEKEQLGLSREEILSLGGINLTLENIAEIYANKGKYDFYILKGNILYGKIIVDITSDEGIYGLYFNTLSFGSFSMGDTSFIADNIEYNINENTTKIYGVEFNLDDEEVIFNPDLPSDYIYVIPNIKNINEV